MEAESLNDTKFLGNDEEAEKTLENCYYGEDEYIAKLID